MNKKSNSTIPIIELKLSKEQFLILFDLLESGFNTYSHSGLHCTLYRDFKNIKNDIEKL